MVAKKKTGKFWIVARDPENVSYHNPTNAIYTLEGAKAHAAKLCKENGHRFFVMEAVAVVEQSAPPVKWVDLP